MGWSRRIPREKNEKINEKFQKNGARKIQNRNFFFFFFFPTVVWGKGNMLLFSHSTSFPCPPSIPPNPLGLILYSPFESFSFIRHLTYSDEPVNFFQIDLHPDNFEYFRLWTNPVWKKKEKKTEKNKPERINCINWVNLEASAGSSPFIPSQTQGIGGFFF